MSDLYQIMKDFGFPVALAIFFVVTSWLREKKTTEAMGDLWRFNQTTLVELVKDGQHTATLCTEAMHANTKATERLIAQLETRPCVADPAAGLRRA